MSRRYGIWLLCNGFELKVIIAFFIQSKADSLDDKPSNLDELKLVLRTISNIRDVSLDIETSIRDVMERYRLLAMYNLLVSSRQWFIYFFN